MMKPRILIFEENKTICSSLKEILVDRGYEVFTFSESAVCPLFPPKDHSNMLNASCSNIILTDLYLPTVNGLKLVKEKIDAGCNIKCRGLMSADWSHTEWLYAQSIGCRLFRKPFDLKEMLSWCDDCRQKIDTTRELFSWNHLR